MKTRIPVVEAAGLLLLTGNASAARPEHFLLLRHPDRWDLPKGHRDSGETLIQTALRETQEETGISPDDIELADGFAFPFEYAVTYRGDDRGPFNKRVTYFLGWLPVPCEILCTEHEGYQWFRWLPPHRIQAQTVDPLLEAVHSFLTTSTIKASD
ncbi:MAG: bis(5'-nucleosyl)-tetraphosphatase [Planctomycetaceae bacterium]